MKYKVTLPNPGSDKAIKEGCRCPVMDNRYGLGAYDGKEGTFWINEDCPLHGKSTEETEK